MRTLLMLLFFTAILFSQEVLDISQTTKCIETFVLLGVAALIVAFDREMFFSREHLEPRGEIRLDFKNDNIPNELSRI